MDLKVVEYALYVPLSVALTIWVATTLSRHGRRFLVDVFNGDEGLADSVNHLLVVGFYLVNLGYVCLQLTLSEPPNGPAGVVEALAGKVGFVLVVLGVMHFGNLVVFAKLRQLARRLKPAPVPPAWIPPVGYSTQPPQPQPQR